MRFLPKPKSWGPSRSRGLRIQLALQIPCASGTALRKECWNLISLDIHDSSTSANFRQNREQRGNIRRKVGQKLDKITAAWSLFSPQEMRRRLVLSVGTDDVYAICMHRKRCRRYKSLTFPLFLWGIMCASACSTFVYRITLAVCAALRKDPDMYLAFRCLAFILICWELLHADYVVFRLVPRKYRTD